MFNTVSTASVTIAVAINRSTQSKDFAMMQMKQNLIFKMERVMERNSSKSIHSTRHQQAYTRSPLSRTFAVYSLAKHGQDNLFDVLMLYSGRLSLWSARAF
jgi:hypothetical protein